MTFNAKRIQVTSDRVLLIEDGNILIDNYGNIAVATKIGGLNKMIYRTEIGKFPTLTYVNSQTFGGHPNSGTVHTFEVVNSFSPVWAIDFPSDVFNTKDISQYSTYTEAFYAIFTLSPEYPDEPRTVKYNKNC